MTNSSSRHVVRLLITTVLTVISPVRTAVAQSAPPRARIVEDLRLDADREDYTVITRFFVGPRKQIVVPIRDDRRFAFYDSLGRRYGSVGGKGSGPGEFLSVDDANVGWKGDTLWAHDTQQRRTSYFAPDMKLIRTVAEPKIDRVLLPNGNRSTDGIGWTTMAMLHDGTIIAFWIQSPQNDLQRKIGRDVFAIRFGVDKKAHAVIKLPKRDERMAVYGHGFSNDVAFTVHPQILVSSSGDRIATLVSHYAPGDSGAYTVSLFRSNGDTIFSKTFCYLGIPTTKAARDSALAAFEKMREGGSVVIKEFQEMSRAKMPSFYSEAETFVVGLDNTLWIGGRRTATGQPFQVLDNAGNILATVPIPPNSRLRQASRANIWVTEKDAYDLTSVVRYKVTGIPCGPLGC